VSDVQQGPGWWQASDGRWYSPEQHPNHQPPAVPFPPLPVQPTSQQVSFPPLPAKPNSQQVSFPPLPAKPTSQQVSFPPLPVQPTSQQVSFPPLPVQPNSQQSNPIPTQDLPVGLGPPPGWWQASDGRWYPPQGYPTAPDAESAKAATKGAKAQAKAFRPWYKKKRFMLPGVGALIIVLVVAVNAANKKNSPAPVQSAASGSTTTTTTSGGNKSASGCTAHSAGYPDKQATDCVALPNNSVALANTVVTATWARSQDSIGDAVICARVTIKNNNSSTISYNELYWKLQTPSGAVLDSSYAETNPLNSGDLVGGGTASGNVCFDDPGTTGNYVGIYKPDPYNATRGIWLFPLG
jgi:Domain of unknown function (DUF4352)